jgi:CBS domain-containing protein
MYFFSEILRRSQGESDVKIIQAKDIMTTNVVTARKDMSLTDVMRLLLRWHISGLPVIEEDGTLAGIITEIDVANMAVSGNASDTRVIEVMSRDVVSFPPETDLSELVHSFSSRRFRRFPIVENGRVTGIVSRRDILREMLRHYDRY